MSLFDAFRLDGKRVLVVGGATGMGAAAAALALDACGGPVHALLACAGVADGAPGIERINFVGHRHLIDRMIEEGMLGRGAAIGFISSAAGLGWEANLEEFREETGVETSTPIEQAYPLLFLCSDAAVGINGITPITDQGHLMSGLTGAFPNATAIAKILMGRS